MGATTMETARWMYISGWFHFDSPWRTVGTGTPYRSITAKGAIDTTFKRSKSNEKLIFQ